MASNEEMPPRCPDSTSLHPKFWSQTLTTLSRPPLNNVASEGDRASDVAQSPCASLSWRPLSQLHASHLRIDRSRDAEKKTPLFLATARSLTQSKCGGVSVRRDNHVEGFQTLIVRSLPAERNAPLSTCFKTNTPLKCACSKLAVNVNWPRSQTRMDRSSPPDKSKLEPSRIINESTSLVWPNSVLVVENVSRLHTLIVLSCDPEHSSFRDKVAAMHLTMPL
mmetsp:Transcript_100922/g.308577  ORF Transcript_100922/g.308577 Transcript_100922/m.308577 type:complete len:222 (-) Transcript_100922:194-859(-)